jgi:hypothetical protein
MTLNFRNITSHPGAGAGFGGMFVQRVRLGAVYAG